MFMTLTWFDLFLLLVLSGQPNILNAGEFEAVSAGSMIVILSLLPVDFQSTLDAASDSEARTCSSSAAEWKHMKAREAPESQ